MTLNDAVYAKGDVDKMKSYWSVHSVSWYSSPFGKIMDDLFHGTEWRSQ